MRNTTISKERNQKRFLAAYAQCGMIAEAARQVGIDRDCHYLWLREAEYREAFEKAKREMCDQVDDEIIRRGMHGVDEPVLYQGEVQYRMDGRGQRTNEPLMIRRYSDTLLIFAAKGLMPEKYRDTWKGEIEHKGEIRRSPDLVQFTLEELRTMRAIAERAHARANSIENGHSTIPAGLLESGSARSGD